MGELSNIEPARRTALTIDVPPHWTDHHFQGRAVLPAVEAMRILADRASRFRSSLDVRCMGAAAFDRFLELPPTGECVEAWCEIQDLADGGLRAALLTKAPSRSARMTRTRVHAQIDFHPLTDMPPLAALDAASALDGVCFSVDPRLLYEELVPFGPGFQSISEPLLLTPEGALAVISSPKGTRGETDLCLGSPFVLDGAFHAACVWSQRFAGVTAFPVGIEQRLVVAPTRPGDTYVSRIFPRETASAILTFDIWILGADGRPFEMLRGVRMRDVSGGKLHPPEWVRSGSPAEPLDRIARHSAAVALIDRATLMPFADLCLAEEEHRRTARMGPKRLIDYMSARIACKRLSRRLSDNDLRTPAREIVTLDPDGIRPLCRGVGGRRYYCSVSHDRRFAVAVAGEQPIGVDVETFDEKVIKSLGLFTDNGEQQVVMTSTEGPVGAAVRVWTMKEAVAKMLNINLAEAWVRAHVLAIEAEQSRIRIADGPEACVLHQRIEDHLFTLVHAV